MKRAILILALLLTGCAARHVKAPQPMFLVIDAPLPSGYTAWVCQQLSGFQRCDAGRDGNKDMVCWEENQATCERVNDFIRVDQDNGLVVYWHMVAQ